MKMIGRQASPEAEWVLRAFSGETGGISITEFAPGIILTGPVIKRHRKQAELYQNRLYASTMEVHCERAWKTFCDWFNESLPAITRLCFSSGYGHDKKDHAKQLFWGKTHQLYDLERLAERTHGYKIHPSRNGFYKGSTISLPWGFLQPHRPGKHEGPYQLQFHYAMEPILALLA